MGGHRRPASREVNVRYKTGPCRVHRWAEMSAVPQYSRTRSPSARRAAASPTARPAPPPAGARGRLPPSLPQGRSCGTPGPPRSVTSTWTTPSPALTATVTVPPGAPEPLCCTLLPNSSPASRAASSPHGCPGPSTAPTNVRATRARSARPATVTLSRTAASPTRPPPFPRRGPRRQVPDPAGRAQRNARSTRRRMSSRNTAPAQPVYGRPCRADGVSDRSHRTDAVRYVSVATVTRRNGPPGAFRQPRAVFAGARRHVHSRRPSRAGAAGS